jgi:hypothetical protein
MQCLLVAQGLQDEWHTAHTVMYRFGLRGLGSLPENGYTCPELHGVVRELLSSGGTWRRVVGLLQQTALQQLHGQWPSQRQLRFLLSPSLSNASLALFDSNAVGHPQQQENTVAMGNAVVIHQK